MSLFQWLTGKLKNKKLTERNKKNQVPRTMPGQILKNQDCITDTMEHTIKFIDELIGQNKIRRVGIKAR